MRRKINILTDNIHGNIEYTSIEKQIFATPIMNRLHNLSQNSTAYLTYPSLKVSRFEHSIGVMHLVHKMFMYSLLNSPLEHINLFAEDLDYTLNKIYNEVLEEYNHQIINFFEKRKKDIIIPEALTKDARQKERIEVINQLLKNNKQMNFNRLKERFIEEESIFRPFIFLNARVSDTKKILSIPILAQAIRLYGLLHDIGHMPYSHIFEFALNRILDLYSEDCLVEILKKYNGVKHKNKLHEKFTVVFIDRTLNYLISKEWNEKVLSRFSEILNNDGIPNNEEVHNLLYPLFLYKVIQKLLNRIVLAHGNEEEDKDINILFSSLNKLVDGPVDADRIDFVMRNAIGAGMAIQPVNFERIIVNYVLIYNKEEKKIGVFPSIRAINDIEKLLKERFSLYKYIVCHHNVMKTDGILRRITYLILEMYQKKCRNLNTESNTLWKDIKPRIETFKIYIEPGDTNKMINYLDDFMQLKRFITNISFCDESWLDTILRDIYFYISEYMGEMKREETGEGSEENFILLRNLLEELIFNKKTFTSVWKRITGFQSFCKKIMKKIDTHFGGSRKRGSKKKTGGIVKFGEFFIDPDNPKSLFDFYRLISIVTEDIKLKEESLFYYVYTKKFIDLIIRKNFNGKVYDFFESMEKHANEILLKDNIKIFIEPAYTKLNSGIGSRELEIVQRIDNNEKIVPIEEISGVKEALERESTYVPLFHIYAVQIDKEQRFEKLNIDDSLRDKIMEIISNFIILKLEAIYKSKYENEKKIRRKK